MSKPQGDWEKFKVGDLVKLKINYNGSGAIAWSYGTIIKMHDEFPLQETTLMTDVGIEIVEYTGSLELLTTE